MMHQNVAGPPCVDGRCGIPEPQFSGAKLLEQGDVVVPRQLCKRRLHNCIPRPGLIEGSHVFQIARREPRRAWELLAQVHGKPVDDARPPAFLLLALKNVTTNGPVGGHKVLISSSNRPSSAVSDPLSDGCEQVRIPPRQCRPSGHSRKVSGFIFTHVRSLSSIRQARGLQDARDHRH